jgi:translation initiation factor 3 subunit L
LKEQKDFFFFFFFFFFSDTSLTLASQLTDRYYKASAWPTAESIAGLVENDGLFLLLYQTLWFKHLFSKLPVSLEARTDAWQNSVAFFDYLLEVKDARDVEAELPLAWVWYIVDAFVNQVQDMAYLRSAIDVSPDVPDRVCDVNVAIGYLERLIDKSTIVQCLKEDRKVGFGQHSLYYTLGYFSIIGLARLRCSLGDYEGTLRVAAPIDVSKKGLYSRAIAAYVALFHSLALAHLMQRQHVACVTVASTMLHFVSRTKQYHQRSYIYHNMIQTSDRLYALLALCSALYSSPLDDQLRNAVRDRFGENMARVTRGNTDAFEELFLKACVRLLPDGALAPAAPPAAAAGAGAEKRSASSAECARVINSARRAADKAAAVRASKLILTAMPQLRSILRLYSTISVSKLAGLLEVDNGTCRQQLDAYLRESPAAGSDVSFRLEGDMLHVIDAAQATSRKTPGEIFARQIRKLDDLSVGAHAPAAPASSSSSSNKE